MQSEKLLQTLSERVERLERQNHRLKQTGLLTLLAIASFFLMGQMKATKALEAGKFILKDGRGKMRAELGLLRDRPMLVFYDEAETVMLSMGAQAEGSGLTIFDADSRQSAVLDCTANGPVLSFFSEGQKRLNLSLTTQGPAIGLQGRTGEARGAIGLTSDDIPFIHLFGSGERGGAQLLVAPDRTALRFFDASDQARAVLGIADKNSDPGLVLNDSNGKARTILMLTSQGPSLDFYDRDGAKIAEVP